MTRRPRGSITEPALLGGSFVGRALNSRSVAMWRVSKPKLRVEERQGVGGLARVVGALDSRDIRPVLTDPARPLSTRCNEGHAGLNSWIQTVDFKRLIWRRGWDSDCVHPFKTKAFRDYFFLQILQNRSKAWVDARIAHAAPYTFGIRRGSHLMSSADGRAPLTATLM